MDETLATRVKALAEPILADHELELVEFACRVQSRQHVFCFLVDRVGGVTLQQCARVNQLIGSAMERDGLVAHSYTVEVSSPGLDRPLLIRRDFERAVGEELVVHQALDDGRLSELRGVLLAVQPDAIVLKLTANNVTVPLARVRSAKKALRW